MARTFHSTRLKEYECVQHLLVAGAKPEIGLYATLMQNILEMPLRQCQRYPLSTVEMERLNKVQ
jgi:hypothetical protein